MRSSRRSSRRFEQANDDLLNLMNNIEIATIFLDDQLRVKRFTPQARSVARLIDTDIGRPLADLATLLDYPDLLSDAASVLESLRASEKQAAAPDGCWYAVRIRPYRTARNAVEGAGHHVHRHHAMQARRARPGGARAGGEHRGRRARAVAGPGQRAPRRSGEPLLLSSCFGSSPRETDGRLIGELGSGQWSIPRLRERLEKTLHGGSGFDDFEVEREFPHLGARRMVSNARPVSLEDDGAAELVLLGIQDAERAAGGSLATPSGDATEEPKPRAPARSASSPSADARSGARRSRAPHAGRDPPARPRAGGPQESSWRSRTSSSGRRSWRRRNRRSAIASSTIRLRSATSRSIPKAAIVEANLMRLALLGLPRSQLIGQEALELRRSADTRIAGTSRGVIWRGSEAHGASSSSSRSPTEARSTRRSWALGGPATMTRSRDDPSRADRRDGAAQDGARIAARRLGGVAGRGAGAPQAGVGSARRRGPAALAGVAEAARPGDAPAAEPDARIRELEELLAESRRRISSLSFQLSPPLLHDVGLVAAAAWLAEDLERRYGLVGEDRRGGGAGARRELRASRSSGRFASSSSTWRSTRVSRRPASGSEREGAMARVAVEDGGVGFGPEARRAGLRTAGAARTRGAAGRERSKSARRPGSGTTVVVSAAPGSPPRSVNVEGGAR